MKKLIPAFWVTVLCFAMGLPAVAADDPAARITEKQVLGLLKTIDAEANRRSVKTAMDHMPKNIYITMLIPTAHGVRTQVVTPEQYKANLEQLWDLTSIYKRTRKEIQIDIAPDGRSATVTAKLAETTEVEGDTINTLVRETLTLELQDGKLMITTMRPVMLDYNYGMPSSGNNIFK